MKPIFSLTFLLFLNSFLFGQQKVVNVQSANEFINALAPNVHIVMAPGIYNLSSVEGVSTQYVSWNDAYDGGEPLIKEVFNLTITGKLGTEILIKPGYAWVLRFSGGRNIRLENLVLGHLEPGFCTGGVVEFSGTQNAEIENCLLFGSGTIGIGLNDVTGFTFSNSVIKACTFGLLELTDSRDLRFERSTFMNTGEYDLIMINGCNNVSFNGSLFRDNFNNEYGPNLFLIDEGCGNIRVQYCKFLNNRVERFINVSQRVSFLDNVFEGNSFVEPRK